MRSTARKTLWNTVLLVASEIANPLLSLLLIGTMSRKLGATGLGAYNLLLTFFFIAHSFTSLGLNTLITREVSREPQSALGTLCSSSFLGIFVALATAVGLGFSLRLAGYDADLQRGGALVGLALLPSIIILYSEAIFIAYEKIQYIVGLAMLENVMKVIIGLWLLHSGFGVMSLIASFTALRFLTLALNLFAFQRQIAPLGWHYDSRMARDLVRNVPVFGTILIVATLYSRADVLLLSKMTTLAAVCYYTAAQRLLTISQTVPKSFNTSIYPVFSNLFAHEPESYRKAKSLSIRYILVVVLPIAAATHGLAAPIVRILFGAEFSPCEPILKVIIWTLVPYGVTKVLASSLFASNRQVIDLKINALSLLTNLLLNLTLIPRYGALGCAWATLLSICFFLACQLYWLRGEIFTVLRQAEILRPTLATAAMLLWLHLTTALLLPLRIAGAAVIYATLLCILKVIPVRELKLLLPERFVPALPEEHEL